MITPSCGTSADFTGDPTLISFGSGTLGALMRKSNGDVLELRYSDLQWTDWTKFGTGTHTPQCVSWADGRMDCVVNPKDSTWYAHNFFDGRWHSWGAYDGIYEAGAVPSIAAWAEGRLDLFYVSSERRLRHKWFDSGWSISSHETPSVLQQVNTVFSSHESEGNKFYMDGESVARTLPGDSGSPLMLRLTKNGVTTYKVAGVCQGHTGMLSRYISTFGFGDGGATKDVGAWLELHLPASQVGRAR